MPRTILKPTPLVIGLALGLGTFIAWYLHALGLVKLLVDQNSHLNITRQVIDSLTPGITQFGFWPPLLHVIMIPFVSSDYLYQTGLAGAAALVPFLALGAFFLYRLLVRFTGHTVVALVGAVSFLLSPYLLYYAATPMMEVLFITMVLGVAYFLSEWMEHAKLRYLMGTALFVALASLARFEGLILIPLVGIVVLLRLISSRKKYHEIEAAMILFGFIAVLGAFAIMSYSWTFGNSPFAFMNSEWSAFSQQRDYVRPTEGDFSRSLLYLLHASYYMIGWPQTWLALISFVLVLLFSRQRLKFLAISLVLASPFIFDLFALYQGNIILYVREFPPYDWFYNERYGLYWISFTVFAPMTLAGLVHLKSIEPSSGFLHRTWITVSSATKLSLGGVLAITVLAANLFYFSQVVFAEKFFVVKESAKRFPVESQMAVVSTLKANYDHGKILMTRALHDYVTVHTGVPLSTYIYESNYRYFDQALERPWLFARFVVMFNNDSRNQNEKLMNWSRSNERVSLAWGDSPVFEAYYNVIHQNSYERVYKIDEAAVRKYAAVHNLKPENVPSLNAAIAQWDPETIYRDMGGETLVGTADLPPHEEPRSKTVENVKAASELTWTYRIKPGETLSSIAKAAYGDSSFWVKIANENDIKKPYRIYAGQILILTPKTSYAVNSP